ncbi:12197_t:CDS:2, partial [Cetraspora pellucida]
GECGVPDAQLKQICLKNKQRGSDMMSPSLQKMADIAQGYLPQQTAAGALKCQFTRAIDEVNLVNTFTGLTDWNETKWSKKLPPTYDDHTKTFTFLFDSSDATKSFYDHEKPRVQNISFTAFVKRSEDLSIPIKLGYKFGDLAFPEFVNSDIYKYEFDHQSNVCFRREIKADEEDKDINCVRLYSFTIAAWKLYYILDCLKADR